MHHEKLAVLALAIHNEKQGRDFYAEAAHRSPDEQGRETFHHLSEMEIDHMRILLAEYERAEQEKPWLSSEEALARGQEMDLADLPSRDEAPEGVLFPPYVFPPEDEAPGIQGDIAVLEYGIEMEQRTYDLYREGWQESTDPNAKEVYALLMNEENRHYKLLQEAHAYLSANETWWDDWERPFFEGG
jgi:rubrerythrin